MKMLMALAVAGVLMLAGCGGGGTRSSTMISGTISGLPSGHTLMSSTIPAGVTRTIHEAGGLRTTVTCQAGGAPCRVTVAPDGTVSYTGGRLTLALPSIGETPISGGGGGGGVAPTAPTVSQRDSFLETNGSRLAQATRTRFGSVTQSTDGATVSVTSPSPGELTFRSSTGVAVDTRNRAAIVARTRYSESEVPDIGGYTQSVTYYEIWRFRNSCG